MSELVRSPEKLIGQPAKEVVLEIFREDLGIKQIAFARYTPNDNEELDAFWKWPDLGTTPTAEGLSDFLNWLTSPELQHQDTEIGVSSLVEITREKDPGVYMDLGHYYAHIPMLNFSLFGVPETIVIRDIKRFLKGEGQRGWILQSDEGSYHFYGKALVETHEWQRLILDALELTSSEFVRQSLYPKIRRVTPGAAQYSLLRVAPSDLHPQIPTVIDVV